MKAFTTRIIVCLVPVLVSLAIVGYAYNQYMAGRGGFKLGVDLVGGTILVYEVDAAKMQGKDWDKSKIQQLAERLKRRLDPAETYGITVRPVSDTRIEVVLPTGGEHQIDAANKQWQAVLDEVEQNWPARQYVVAPGQGKETKLLAQINAQHPDVGVDEVRSYITTNYVAKAPEYANKPTEQRWDEPAKQAKLWQDFLGDASKQYPLKGYDAGRGQLVELRDQVLAEHPGLSEDEKNKLDQFFNPKDRAAQQKLQGGQTMEGVQEAKERIQQQGSLEFLIVASEGHDSAGMRATQDQFKKKPGSNELEDQQFARELQQQARDGLPPPPPRGGQKFPVTDPNGDYSYRWVELGADFRKEAGLQNLRINGRVLTEQQVREITDPFTVDQWKPLKGTENGESAAQNQLAAYIRVLDALDKNEPMTFTGRGMPFLMYARKAQSIRRTSQADREKEFEYFALCRTPGDIKITGDDLLDANANGDEVDFTLRSSSADLFYEFTSQNKTQPMAIVLDGYIRSAPTIQSPIRSSGRITGHFTRAQLDNLVLVLRYGALPASLKQDPVSENTMGPTLGADTIKWGTISVGIAFAAILIFMLIYYRFAGFVACVALLANLLLTVAFMVLVQATFTLPGLAGLVLMLGMAVDANVLIYERLREERDRGASLGLAIRNGYDRAFPTIIDTHLSSIFTAIVLYVVGNEQLKGFGISLTVGLIISLFTSLYMTRTMFDFWLARGWLHKLSMLRLFSRPNFDFMAIRYYWFTATIILTVVGASLFVYRLDKGGLNIDFMGGTAYSGQLTQKMDIGQLRALLDDDARQREKLKVESVKQDGPDGHRYLITYAGSSEPVSVTLANPPKGGTEEVKQRASQLPDLSVEQMFVSSSEYTEGNKSVFFTVRTVEKEADLVQVSISRLLTDENGKELLKSIYVKSYDIVPDEKDPSMTNYATLAFTNVSSKEAGTHPPDFASRAQVARIVSMEFERLANEQNDPGLAQAGKRLTIRGLGQDKDGRFQWMEVGLTDKVKFDRLKTVLDRASADFAARPQPERLENFDAQLAAETQTRAMYAILASWGAILLYLWFRFGNWTFGAAAVLCLIHDLFFTLGGIAIAHWLHGTLVGEWLGLRDFRIDLQTVAALLTLVGYSVNDTIVVFDRIREVRGKNPDLTPQMINDGVNQTLSRTLLAALATWLVVFVLYVLGGEGVHLFAFVMVVGVIVGTYSSIYIASPLLLIFGEGRRSKTGVSVPQTAGTPA